MSELIGRKAIAEYLNVSCGEVSRLILRRLPVRFDGRQMVADSAAIDAWKREHDERKEA